MKSPMCGIHYRLDTSFCTGICSKAIYNERMARIKKFLLTALACLPVAAADLAPTGTLRATFLNNNPVQALVDAKTGEVTGPAADIVKALARRAGVPYTLTPSNGAKQMYEDLNQHKYDIGFLAFEAERASQVDFSGPYLLMGVSYLVPADSPIKTAADADRAGIRIGAVEANSPTIYLQQHLKNAKVVTWPAQPAYEEVLKKFSSAEVDAFAGNRARLVEAAARYPGLRVAQDNFAEMEQNIVVQKGDSLKLKVVNEFLDEARASGFLKDSLVRAKLDGVKAPPPKKP
jgi:polar amino acid transport system substrate-binding protein